MTSPGHRFGIAFMQLARQWRRAVDARLAEAGLTDATWSPLVHLDYRPDGVVQKDLAHLVGIDDSSLVRLVDLLEQRQLIERRVDEQDRRAKRIVLTDIGRTAVRDIRKTLHAAEAEMLAGLGDEEIAAMLDAFARIMANAQEARP